MNAIRILALALTVACGIQYAHAASGPTSNGTHSVPAVAGDCAAGENCYRLAVRCTTNVNDAGIPLRFRPPAPGRTEFADLVIRESGVSPANQPLGGIVFFTGQFGTAFYGNGNAADTSPADQTVTIVGTQYTAFEVRWLDAPPSEIGTNVPISANPLSIVNQTLNPGHGNVSGSEGYGAAVDKCGVEEVFEWLSANRTPLGDQKLCATGNSGGGMQIAYALTIYGAADYLKSAVLTGGPSYARIYNGCFDTLYNNGLSPLGVPNGTLQSLTLGIAPLTHPGRQFLEATLGWPAGTCSQFHPYSSDAAKKAFAQKTSLVAIDDNLADLEFRDYAARDRANVLTNQFFVRGSMDQTGAQIQGNTYISKLTAAGGLLSGAVNDVVASDGGSPPDFLQHDIFDTPAGAAKIRTFLRSNNNCTYAAAPTPFTLVDRGGVSLLTSGKPDAAVAVGSARILPNAGSTSPSGLAIFALRQNGVLVTEAGVPASPSVQTGRIYAEVNDTVNTGLAIANPNPQDATVNFYFSDQTGNFGNGTATVPAGGQISGFLDQEPFKAPSFIGTLTFSSSVPVAVVALRGFYNERREFLLTTLPIVDLGVAAATGTVVLPHFADGGGWTTQIVLINPTDNALTGNVQFRDQAGLGATITIGNQSGSTFGYTIPPRSSQKLRMSGLSTSTVVGSIRVVPAANGVAPAGVAIFSFRNGAATVAEAGVPSVAAGTAFRVYAVASGNPGAVGSIQTGLAVSNLSATEATVTLDLYTLSGSSTGLKGTVTIPPNGQKAVFLNQASGLGALAFVPFQGVLRLSSTESISVVALRGRYNERSDFLVTTIPTVNESTPATGAPLYFPHIADAGGYTTQFILYSGRANQSASGRLAFFRTTGSDWTLSLQ